MGDSTLRLLEDKGEIKSFEIKSLDIGAKRTLAVTNLAVSRKTQSITFIIETNDQEITTENNRVVISAAS